MTGKEMIQKIKSFGYKKIEIAELMGISEQALNSKLKTTDIKVSFVQKLAEITNKSVYEWLSIDNNGQISEPQTEYNNWRTKYYELLEDYKTISDKLNDCLESKGKN
jgi:hypothetical protein